MIDRVYGEVSIDDPLALEIITTSEFQRLRGVDQAGFMHSFKPEYSHSRYEHSIGAYLLLDKYGASREEKISGLIHDISHTAFSHCTEYAIEHTGDVSKAELQDTMHEDYVLNSKISDIIDAGGMDVETIIDESNFPLLENQLPSICADRIDYSLRGSMLIGSLSKTTSAFVLKNLDTIDSQWVYSSPESARFHATYFRELNDFYWSNIETAVMFYSVGEFLKRAIELELILTDELHVTDVEILADTVPYTKHDAKLQKHWNRMNNWVVFSNNPDDYEVALPCKSRVIDPLCIEGDDIKPLSETETNEDWADVVRDELVPKTYYLKFND